MLRLVAQWSACDWLDPRARGDRFYGGDTKRQVARGPACAQGNHMSVASGPEGSTRALYQLVVAFSRSTEIEDAERKQEVAPLRAGVIVVFQHG